VAYATSHPPSPPPPDTSHISPTSSPPINAFSINPTVPAISNLKDANKNEFQVSRGKDGQCGGREEARARGLKEGGDGKESEIRKHQGQTRRGQGKEDGGSVGVRRIER
jgi:hypothetical protein